MRRMNKKAISPLIATLLLVAFAVALGAVVMNWSQGIESHEEEVVHGCIIEEMPDDPVKKVMIQYIKDEITLDEARSRI